MLLEEDSSLPALCEALTDEDADVRWFAAEAMVRFGPLDALPSLLEMPRDDMAAASFVDFCVKHGESTLPRLLEALRTKFDLKWWRSLPIDVALERIGDACVPFLERMLAEDDARNREKASRVLDRLSGTPSLERLLELSRSRRDRERRLAAKMLAWHDEPVAAERLVEMARDRNGRVRKEAVKALGWVDHPQAERAFQDALSDPSAKVRRWAERGLEMVREIKPLLDT
jgi:HEAT repeat protein